MRNLFSRTPTFAKPFLSYTSSGLLSFPGSPQLLPPGMSCDPPHMPHTICHKQHEKIAACHILGQGKDGDADITLLFASMTTTSAPFILRARRV